MTKPLIEQLFDRAGITDKGRLEVGDFRAHCSHYELACVVFELCAYLDEQPKAKTQAESIGDLLYESDRNNVVLPGSHVCAPDCPDSHRSNVELRKPPAKPDVAIPGACYCSDEMSGGIPCPPNWGCPNAPKPPAASEVAERSELELLHSAYAEKIAHFNDQAAQLAEARADLARVEKNLATAVEDAEWVCKDRDKLLDELKSKDQALKLYKLSSMQLKSRLYNAEEKIRVRDQF